MNIDKLEQEVKSLSLSCDENSFIFDLLIAYELPQASITRLKKGDYNLSKKPGEILWKKRVCFKVDKSGDLHTLIDSLQNDQNITKHHPRFIIVTDFKDFLAVDTKIKDSLDIQFDELHKHYDFFLPWAGMEKSQLQSENPADIKAAERMGKLYDLILEDNPVSNDAQRHALNVFLSRLLFCFFAEDTGIFKDDQFTNALASHTSEDGSDLRGYLQKLFLVLNTLDHSEFAKYLQDFPYVNGGLFAENLPVPRFSAKSRRIILECGELNWKAINPDIFGSMIQAVIHEDMRGGLGMHYTSVTNIMKVIEPLFLNDLYEELQKAGESKTKLNALLNRIYHLKIFDPACGSGNFLIIAYKELCKLEIEAFKRFYQGRMAIGHSRIKLTQFYGIELDDFAHETAKLSMWLAEHQMNLAFREIFGETKPTLPLRDGGNIICGNATRIDWSTVCPRDNEDGTYIIGNPPYIGYSNRDQDQKQDMDYVFDRLGKVKRLDYIGCWFKKASDFISNTMNSYAFVSTNSICQGEQAGLIWPYIFSLKQEIQFAYQSFKWTNSAKGKAGVTCVIIGVSGKSGGFKYLFSDRKQSLVKSISPYLIEGSEVVMFQRKSPISDFPIMSLGSSGIDGGHLLLSGIERNTFIENDSRAEKFIKLFVGGGDAIKGNERFCLWIDDNLAEALDIDDIKDRVDKCRIFRETGGRDAKKAAEVPHRFFYRKYQESEALILPMTSSGRRNYLPLGFANPGTVVSNGAFVIYDVELYLFAVLSSRMHAVWMSVTSARMRTDYRYSVNLTYNTFPFPQINEDKQRTLEELVFQVLDERELHPEKSIADLYDPEKMPKGLLCAHQEIDKALEACYQSQRFVDDDQRLKCLFELYGKMERN